MRVPQNLDFNRDLEEVYHTKASSKAESRNASKQKTRIPSEAHTPCRASTLLG